MTARLLDRMTAQLSPITIHDSHPHPSKKEPGKLIISHRYNHLPLLPSGPGGIQQELAV